MELTWGLRKGAAAMAEGSEAALLDRCRRHDVEAFGKFVDLYQARVMGYARRMLPSHEEAEDVTQEVFVRAFQSFGRYDGRANVRTWLFRIAHNLCVDRGRRANRRLQAGTLDEDGDGETVEVMDGRWRPDFLMLEEELGQVVDRAVAELSDKLRAVLLLHDREEMSYEEIAGTLGVPIGTVRSRLFLARQRLQRALAPYLELETS